MQLFSVDTTTISFAVAFFNFYKIPYCSGFKTKILA